jgi:hypothetical protein
VCRLEELGTTSSQVSGVVCLTARSIWGGKPPVLFINVPFQYHSSYLAYVLETISISVWLDSVLAYDILMLCKDDAGPIVHLVCRLKIGVVM